MKYRITGSCIDNAGHHLLVLQERKTLNLIRVCETEIEARPCHHQMQYVLKAITLDDRRIWLQIMNSLPAAVAAKCDLDWILNNTDAGGRKENTS